MQAGFLSTNSVGVRWRWGPSTKPSPCLLAETESLGKGCEEPRESVLEQVVREGHSKEAAFSRGLKEAGRVRQDKTWGDAVGLSGAARPGRLEWSVGDAQVGDRLWGLL